MPEDAAVPPGTEPVLPQSTVPPPVPPINQEPVSEPVAAQDVPEAPAPYEPPPAQPEPTPVGHGLIQDNVTTPGTQVTTTADGTLLGTRVTADRD